MRNITLSPTRLLLIPGALLLAAAVSGASLFVVKRLQAATAEHIIDMKTVAALRQFDSAKDRALAHAAEIVIHPDGPHAAEMREAQAQMEELYALYVAAEREKGPEEYAAEEEFISALGDASRSFSYQLGEITAAVASGATPREAHNLFESSGNIAEDIVGLVSAGMARDMREMQESSLAMIAYAEDIFFLVLGLAMMSAAFGILSFVAIARAARDGRTGTQHRLAVQARGVPS